MYNIPLINRKISNGKLQWYKRNATLAITNTAIGNYSTLGW